MGWWRGIADLCRLGVSDAENGDVARRIWLTNAIGLIAALASACFVGVHLSVGAPLRGGLIGVSAIVFSAVPLLSWVRRLAAARVVMILALNLNVLVLQASDPASHLWVCFIPIACAAMLLFTHAERRGAWVGAVVSVVLALLSLSGGLEPAGAWMMQPPIPRWIDWAVVALAMFMTPVMIGMLNHQVAMHDVKESAARAALQGEVVRNRAISEQLAVVSAEANAASRAKSAFLANMSHEIRTPLAAVISLTDMARSSDEDRRDEYLELVSGSAQHLLQILNDILDLSKVEAGRLELERTPCDLSALVDDVVSIAKVRAAEHPVRVLAELSLQGQSWRVLDPLRLKQVLLNLLGNALKFTEVGSVTLSVRGNGERVRFEVEDTGIGMTAEQAESVFEPFHQAEGSTARRYGGTGLGLSICRRIIEVWDSELELHSEPGVGTRLSFTLTLPVAEAPQVAAAPAVPQLPTGRLRVLVAEDNSVNQLIARRVLELRGHEVVVVEHGGHAVEAVQHGFDVVLMDLHMPVVDGRTATRRIREIEREQGLRAIPIVALTANAMSGEEALCHAAGMDAYLTKPIDVARLEDVLGRVVGRRSAS